MPDVSLCQMKIKIKRKIKIHLQSCQKEHENLFSITSLHNELYTVVGKKSKKERRSNVQTQLSKLEQVTGCFTSLADNSIF